MNASELITEVRELLDEPASTSATTPYFTDARILAWLNQTYIEFCRHTNWTVRKTNYLQGATYMNAAASTASSPIHNMPADFMKIDPLNGVFWLNGTEMRKLAELDKVQACMEGWFDSINCTGTPLKYFVRYLDMDLKGLTAPVTAPVVAAAGTGSFAATTGYSYKYTYYNSSTTQESTASTATSSGAFTGKATCAVGYYGSGDSTVDYIKLYRTTDGGSSYYLVTTVANATSSYNDNMADGTLITKTAYSATSVSGNVIETYPYPSSAGNNLQVYYVALPPMLVTSPTANAPVLPYTYQWALVYGAVAIGKMKRRLYDEKKAYEYLMMELFEQGLSETQDRGIDEFDVPTNTYLPYRY